MAKKVWFIGVSTSHSLIHKVFGAWASLLGVDVGIKGVGLPLDAPDEEYRSLLDRIREDDDCLGAVVTTHKIRLFEASRDIFSEFDAYADACREVNAIRKGEDGLHAFARDPISAGRVLDDIWPGRESEVLCLGAGGTAIALGKHLLSRTVLPSRLTFVDIHAHALERVSAVLGYDSDIVVTRRGDGPWDTLLQDLPSGSLVVNATGIGKDRSGSLFAPSATFPMNSTFWELNYRGDLQDLRLAREQSRQRDLQVHDGFSLFSHGWASALAAVLEIPDDPDLGTKFLALANPLR